MAAERVSAGGNNNGGTCEGVLTETFIRTNIYSTGIDADAGNEGENGYGSPVKGTDTETGHGGSEEKGAVRENKFSIQ